VVLALTILGTMPPAPKRSWRPSSNKLRSGDEPSSEIRRATRRRQRSGRVAYAFSSANLPSPGTGLDWRLDHDFKAGEEILADDQLKTVFKLAIDAGCAIVDR
jgi:hypothetical protein